MSVCLSLSAVWNSGITQEFFWGGRVQRIQLRTEGRGKRNLGALTPKSGVPLNLQMSETRILIRLLRMYFPWNWEFGLALSKLQNFVVGLNPPSHWYAIGMEWDDLSITFIFHYSKFSDQVTVKSMAQVCGCPPSEIVGSNPTDSMDVCHECCVLLCRGPCNGLIAHLV
jgi:hypothetical protein